MRSVYRGTGVLTVLLFPHAGMQRFYVHEAAEMVTPWKRVSDVAHCGIRTCSKTLTFTEQDSTTITRTDGTPYTVGESESDATATAFGAALKSGLSVGVPGVFSVNTDLTLTVTDTQTHTTGRSSSWGSSRTYSTPWPRGGRSPAPSP